MNTDGHGWKNTIVFLSVFICVHLWFLPRASAQTFEKRWLSGQFYSEGADCGDFNNDGKMDVVNGPFIYDGPDFTMKRAFMPVQALDPLVYSTVFFEFASDFNNDGWQDVMTVGFPGAEAAWCENPQGKTGEWKRHLVFKSVDDESPVLTNIVGDGKPELVCISDGRLGYASPDASDPTKIWTFHGISPKADYQRFTHGLGVGDVNGDGRMDLLEKTAWWEQPEKLDGDPVWQKHPFAFADFGGAQMYAYDVDGDGDNDVVTATHAHGYGIAWYEQNKDKGEISFVKHPITSAKADEKLAGVQFSQPHAMAVIDMDGDGLLDLVTGKRYWAHGPHGPDPDSEGRAVLYWFKLVRDGDKKTGGAAHFEPRLIDDNSGVGVMIVAADINGDKKPDVVVGNKKGQILFLSK